MTHGTAYAYNKLGCRCDACRAAYAERRRQWASAAPKHRTGPLLSRNGGRADDGIVDWVVVERLLAREMPWRDATLSERKAACARAFAQGWEDAYVYAQDYLRLRSDAIKAVRADLESWLAVAA